MPELFILSRLLLLQPHCRTTASWHPHSHGFIIFLWSYYSTTVCIISLHVSSKIWINHIIRNIRDTNISPLAAPSVLAAALICFVLVFLILSMVRTSCPFSIIYSMKYLAAPQKGYPIGAAVTMLPVIIIPFVHLCAYPESTNVSPCSWVNNCLNHWAPWCDFVITSCT